MPGVDGFQSITGKGVTGNVNGQSVALGNWKLMEQLGVAVDAKLAEQADRLREEGQTVMMMAVDGRFGGLLAVADPIKESAREAIEQLRGEGVRIVMLTGDNQKTAHPVSRELGLDEVFAEVLEIRRQMSSNDFKRKEESRRWRATESMTLRRWPRLT